MVVPTLRTLGLRGRGRKFSRWLVGPAGRGNLGSMRVATILATLAIATPAAAQAPGPPLPLGMDLRKAPVGAWSEYTMTVADLPVMKQRFAVVGRDAATHAVEMTTEGGSLGKARVVLRFTLEADPAKKDRVRKLVMQLGDNQPMELPSQPGQFSALNPKKQVGGAKTLKVAAGSFTTRHFKDKSAANGSVMEVWVSDQAPPFGIVKMTGSSDEGKNPFTMELVARGDDAKPLVTKSPQQFDQEVLKGQMQRALGGK
jgi:hypothetical protein